MLTNLSATPPFASLLRKEEDNKPSGLPSTSNLRKSPAILQRRVRNTLSQNNVEENYKADVSYFFSLFCIMI